MMVLTDNKYQCAPFPCIEGASHIEDDSSYRGQIFIFNKKDNRCRSKDKFLV
ncbi:hypothetical protein IO382_001547 [Campylobacter lari]|nr:hypothetical protein [Campylobacter lari]